MDLVNGRRYLHRDGTISDPLERAGGGLMLDNSTGYLFCLNDTGDGRNCLVHPGLGEHPKDLTEEIIEPELAEVSYNMAVYNNGQFLGHVGISKESFEELKNCGGSSPPSRPCIVNVIL